jgi:hypothetical protein
MGPTISLDHMMQGVQYMFGIVGIPVVEVAVAAQQVPQSRANPTNSEFTTTMPML